MSLPLFWTAVGFALLAVGCTPLSDWSSEITPAYVVELCDAGERMQIGLRQAGAERDEGLRSSSDPQVRSEVLSRWFNRSAELIGAQVATLKSLDLPPGGESFRAAQIEAFDRLVEAMRRGQRLVEPLTTDAELDAVIDEYQEASARFVLEARDALRLIDREVDLAFRRYRGECGGLLSD
jgi:hypothetical protein